MCNWKQMVVCGLFISKKIILLRPSSHMAWNSCTASQKVVGKIQATSKHHCLQSVK